MQPLDIGSRDRLEDAPTHLELMTKVAVNWRYIGLNLGLDSNNLNAIEDCYRGDYRRCFECVFSAWERQKNVPFTWAAIIKALESPLVEENRLAEEIKSALLGVQPQ